MGKAVEVTFSFYSPYVLVPVLLWALVLGRFSLLIFDRLVGVLELKSPHRVQWGAVFSMLLDLVLLLAMFVGSPYAEIAISRSLFLLFNPEFVTVGIWGNPPWWLALIFGPALGLTISCWRVFKARQMESLQGSTP